MSQATDNTKLTLTPEIDYLSKDFESFRRLMLDHMALLTPDWQEDNPADLGNVLLDVLANAADYASYYQDAVASEAYLDTARLRRSVRRHVRLLDYVLHEGCNARVWVHVKVAESKDNERDGVLLAARTQLLTRVEGLAPMIEPNEPAYLRVLSQNQARIFETMHAARLYPSLNRLSFQRDEGAGSPEWLPSGSTSAALKIKSDWLDASREPVRLRRLRPGDVLILEEIRNPRDHFSRNVDPARRHAVRLTECNLDTMYDQQSVRITWAAADALPFPLYIAQHWGQDVSVARGNIILADHGETVTNVDGQKEEVLAPVPDGKPYRPQLRFSGLTHREAYDAHRARSQAASDTLRQKPWRALPAVLLVERGPELRVEDETRSLLPVSFTPADSNDPTKRSRPQYRWRLQPDLLGSDQLARDFACEIEGDKWANLRFGNDDIGRTPDPGSQFVATYRLGNGVAGNLGPDSIAHIVVDSAQSGRDEAQGERIKAVCNPLPAVGGAEREPIAAACLHAPSAFRRQQRCITAEDYVVIAERHIEVYRAMARLRRSGSGRAAFVYVQRIAALPVDEPFRAKLDDYFATYRLLGVNIEILGPRFVPLSIELEVQVAPTHNASTVERDLWYAFSTGRLSESAVGFFHPTRFTFGQPVYRSQIIVAAMATPGVAMVDVRRFQRAQDDAAHDRTDNNALIELQPLEIAQVKNDPHESQAGTITFSLKGGL